MAKKPNSANSKPPSKILLDECFSSGDSRFVEELKRFDSPKFLVGFVEKWLGDSRPWAREQVVVYLDGNLNLPGHEVVFKRIFNHFRHANDHEMMSVLMVALDRIVRRSRVTAYHYTWNPRRSWTTERLYAKPNKSTVSMTGRTGETVHRGKTYRYPIPDVHNKAGNKLFTNRTRSYLRRSVWRYFRYLSHREPEVYVSELAKALARYRNQDFFVGENIIDNWSMMHACFFHDPAIMFTASHTNLVEGKSLDQLTPHPYQPAAWRSETGKGALIELLVNANSSLIRTWAIELFLKEHKSAVGEIKLESLVEMLASPDPQLQDFAQNVFAGHPALPTLTVEQWLNLIDSSSVNLLALICQSMKKHVSDERMDDNQLIQLTNAKQAPASQLGFELLQSRNLRKPVSKNELIQLADCQCSQQAETITAWALEQICQRNEYDADSVIEFFDALSRRTRNAAMNWLQNSDSPGFNDPLLWSRLIETPFDDVKIQLIELLNRRETRPADESDQFASVWVSVILGVHRGGRTKPKAINQLANQIIRKPSETDSLLPVLAVAIRSTRSPEMRNALSAVVRLARSSPELLPKIQALIPELEFDIGEDSQTLEAPA